MNGTAAKAGQAANLWVVPDIRERAAKFKRLKRRGTRSLLFAGLVLVVLNFLFCVAYVLLNLAQQAAPL